MTRKTATTFALAAAMATAGAGAGVSSAVSGSSTHTVKFVSKQSFNKNFPHHRFTGTDKDIAHGKVIGTDVVTGQVHRARNRVTGFVSFAWPGGVIHSTFSINYTNGALTGHITGGAGKYAGVTGTIKGVPSDKTGEDFAITATYRH
jgi:hypothetical protein